MNLATYAQPAAQDSRGHREKRQQVYVYGVWSTCRVCNITKPWDELTVDNFLPTFTRSQCFDCRRMGEQTPTDADAFFEGYRLKSRGEAQRLWGRRLGVDPLNHSYIAFSFDMTFVVGETHWIYLGVTPNAPKLRFIQHFGATEVDSLTDAAAAQQIHSLSGVERQATLLPDAHQLGTGENRMLANIPIFNCLGHESITDAYRNAMTRYEKIREGSTIGNYERKLINTHAPVR